MDTLEGMHSHLHASRGEERYPTNRNGDVISISVFNFPSNQFTRTFRIPIRRRRATSRERLNLCKIPSRLCANSLAEDHLHENNSILNARSLTYCTSSSVSSPIVAEHHPFSLLLFFLFLSLSLSLSLSLPVVVMHPNLENSHFVHVRAFSVLCHAPAAK